MTAYSLDTNHISAMLKKHPAILEKIGENLGSASVGVAIISIAELWFMAFKTARVEQNTRDLDEMLAGLTRFDFGEDAAKEFGRIKADLRKKGRTIPDPDSQIAAIARVNDMVVLTADAHFSYVTNLKTENWLS